MRCPHCGKNIAIPEKAAPLLDDSQMRAANAHEADWITRRLDIAERAVVVLQNDARDRAKQITDLRREIKQLLEAAPLPAVHAPPPLPAVPSKPSSLAAPGEWINGK